MNSKDATKKITRILLSFLFLFSLSFFVLPVENVVAACGNGVVDGADQCDPPDFDGEDCNSLGFDGGVLGCDAGCNFDTSSCCTRNDPTFNWTVSNPVDGFEGEILAYNLDITNNNLGNCTVTQNTFNITVGNFAPAAAGQFTITGAPASVTITESGTQNISFNVQSSKNSGFLAVNNYAFNVEAIDADDGTYSITSVNNGYNITELYCAPKNPTLSLAPNSTDTGSAGTTIDYDFTITNDDRSGCASRDFVVEVTGGLPSCAAEDDWLHTFCGAVTIPPLKPTYCLNSGTTPSFSYQTGNIAAQTTKTENFELSSCLTIASNTYPFTIEVRDGSNASTDSDQYIVSVAANEICNNGFNDNPSVNALADCSDPACLGFTGAPACCGNGIKEGIETCDSDADCGPNEACSGCSSCVSTIRTNQCPIGFDDCDCNSSTGFDGCEMEVHSDPNNCGGCGITCNSGKCVNGACLTITGGLVPCGRIADNPNTIWNEQEPCKICHTVPLVNNIIDYLIGIAGLIATLSIIIGGLMSITSMGGSTTLSLAKTVATKSLYGFVFVLVAWVIVNIGMVIFGFNDPFGDGRWSKIECDLITNPIGAYCGDGTVQKPNSDGTIEQCDPKETLATYQLRTYNTPKQWVESIYSCDPVSCSPGCVGDPNAGRIGEGCYLIPGGCQRGKYICDHSTSTVVCENTFNDPNFRLSGDMCGDVYDYCCDSNSGELADGKVGNAPFLIVKASIDDIRLGASGTLGLNNWMNLATGYGAQGFGAGYGFKCDDVCKNVGKVCIGVGLTDPSSNSCIYIANDMGGTGTPGCANNGRSVISMDLPGNQASSNCDAWFGMFYYSNAGGTGLHYSTGYDKYEYHCVNDGLDSYWRIFNPNSKWAGYGGFNPAPPASEGVCKPAPPDNCEFHGFDLAETACYCL